MTRSRIPDVLKAPEIERRIKAMVKAMRAADPGFQLAGTRITPEGEITILDKSALPAKDDGEEEWV